MDQTYKEEIVARIVAGYMRCTVEGCVYVIKKPSLEDIYISHLIAKEYKEECGGVTEDYILDFMMEHEIWTPDDQQTLDTCIKNIDELKVQLYNAMYKSNEKQRIKLYIKATKDEMQKLMVKRNLYNFATNTGAASLLRSRYLIAMSLYYKNGQRCFDEETFWSADAYLLDQIVDIYYSSRLAEEQFRELARTEPWRSIWNNRKSEGSLFGIPSTELNDEQRVLVSWSTLYDNVYEHSECPPDDVIGDDDTLDGWLIIQRRKRQSDDERNKAENLVSNEQIKNSGEVFIPVDTMEDAKKIDSLNDTHARMVKRQRLATVRKRGVVHEAAMPDSMQEIQQEITKKFLEKNKG
jgi:hypothetical protein